MSTTLTNGVIIPDNGSRNWGGDLANNWNILDVHVGYMSDVKNKVTTLENSVAENTANIQINTSNISALQTSKQDAYYATLTTVTMHVGSVLTSNGKVVSFVVPINVNGSPAIAFARLRLRSHGNYLFGSSANSDVTTSYTFSATVFNGGINVIINFSDADTNAINNSCIVSEIALKLTY